MTRSIDVTNITYNRLRNYFPHLTPAHAIRELFKIALANPFNELETVKNGHRDGNYYEVGKK